MEMDIIRLLLQSVTTILAIWGFFAAWQKQQRSRQESIMQELTDIRLEHQKERTEIMDRLHVMENGLMVKIFQLEAKVNAMQEMHKP